LLELPVVKLQIYTSRARQHLSHDSELRMPQ